MWGLLAGALIGAFPDVGTVRALDCVFTIRRRTDGQRRARLTAVESCQLHFLLVDRRRRPLLALNMNSSTINGDVRTRPTLWTQISLRERSLNENHDASMQNTDSAPLVIVHIKLNGIKNTMLKQA